MSEYDATEAAVALAAEHGIDLSTVEGSGHEGRITKQDVEGLLGEEYVAAPIAGSSDASSRSRVVPAGEERTTLVRGSVEAPGPKTWDGPAR